MLEFTERGIFCPAGDFYIDPWRPVDRALITHGHADHARPGHRRYLCARDAASVIRHRLGDIALDSLPFGERRAIGDVTVSFHPAGHIPGSAQIRLERTGEVWVVSGDYKLEPDGVSTPFEPVRCHAFLTECTFGLPIFKWRPQPHIIADIHAWWQENRDAGRISVLGAYSLGKAQRLLAHLDRSIGPVFTHPAIASVNALLRNDGIALPVDYLATPELERSDVKGALVIVPPAATDSAWLSRLGEISPAFASGWMAVRGIRRRRNIARGFALSDHADWTALNTAIAATGATRVFVTHGYASIFTQWLTGQGYDAKIVSTEYDGDEHEAEEPVQS